MMRMGRIYLVGILLLLRCALCTPLRPSILARGLSFDLNEIPVEDIDDGLRSWMQTPAVPVGHDSSAAGHVRFAQGALSTRQDENSFPLQSQPPQSHGQLLSTLRHTGPLAASQASQGFHTPEFVEPAKLDQPSLRDADPENSLSLKRPLQFQDGSSPAFQPQRSQLPGPTSSDARARSDPNLSYLQTPSEQNIGGFAGTGSSLSSGSSSHRQDSIPWHPSTQASTPSLGAPVGQDKSIFNTLPKDSSASSSSSHPLLPALEIPKHERKKLRKIPSLEDFDLASIVNKREADVRALSVQDPSRFSGALFKMSKRWDPNVNQLMASIGASPSARDTTADIGPWSLGANARRDPHTFFRNYFSRRKEAIQVIFRDNNAQRSLLLTLLTNHRWIAGRRSKTLVGVWEIASDSENGRVALDFFGFHPFYPLKFAALERRAAGSGHRYLLQRDPTPSQEEANPPIKLKIFRVQKEALAAEEQGNPALGPGLLQQPDMQRLIESGELDRAIAISRLTRGNHVYVYQESAQTLAVIERWKRAADIASGSFTLLKLDADQKAEVAMISAGRYQVRKKVKVVREDDGETFMLDFYPRLYWKSHSQRNTIAVWQFGPAIGGKRLMICRGFYHVEGDSYDRLTPGTVRGLQNFVFQYNMATLPS
ncbi:conserved hypothetical Ustilaginaceae-specific protein [Sporisorium reilianum SRZ2]|uniref:Conserved hypothetical Ustilaginaceae-specific protein n=1 Tax=Sporisorium reilianum (strain SRZ2) TaxID=999809 RepID=E6ZTT7_SPORE|nr:conserved hypothetical Ustilaginaceae-specific protein [Sporisorium reilianum SRZ2]